MINFTMNLIRVTLGMHYPIQPTLFILSSARIFKRWAFKEEFRSLQLFVSQSQRLRRSLFTDWAEWSNIWLYHTSSGPFYLFYFRYVRHPRNVPLSRFIFKFIYGERLSLYATDHRARRPVISYLSFLLSN